MIEVSMTPAQFAAAGARLKAEMGLELTGNRGTLAKHGVEASYFYDGAALHVNVSKKPFPLTANYCEKELLAWLAAS